MPDFDINRPPKALRSVLNDNHRRVLNALRENVDQFADMGNGFYKGLFKESFNIKHNCLWRGLCHQK